MRLAMEIVACVSGNARSRASAPRWSSALWPFQMLLDPATQTRGGLSTGAPTAVRETHLKRISAGVYGEVHAGGRCDGSGGRQFPRASSRDASQVTLLVVRVRFRERHVLLIGGRHREEGTGALPGVRALRVSSASSRVLSADEPSRRTMRVRRCEGPSTRVSGQVSMHAWRVGVNELTDSKWPRSFAHAGVDILRYHVVTRNLVRSCAIVLWKLRRRARRLHAPFRFPRTTRIRTRHRRETRESDVRVESPTSKYRTCARTRFPVAGQVKAV